MIDQAQSATAPVFNLSMPTSLPGVDARVLDPRNSYTDASEWQNKAQNLASLFVENFVQYTDTDKGKGLVEAGPKL